MYGINILYQYVNVWVLYVHEVYLYNKRRVGDGNCQQVQAEKFH